MIKYFTLDNEKLRNTGKETDQTIWYCVERPNQEEIHQLTHQFEIPSDYITSILTMQKIPVQKNSINQS